MAKSALKKGGGPEKNGKKKVGLSSDMYSEVEKHHGLHMIDDEETDGRGSKSKAKRQDDDEDDYEEDVAPVFDLDASGSEDDDGDEDDDEDLDDDEEDDDGSQSDEDDDARAAALAKEERLATAWGKKKSTFYDADSDAEIDEDAAAAEEEEAVRLQKKRAAELDEDDTAFGVAALNARSKAAAGKGKAEAKASGKSGQFDAAGATASASSAVERVSRDPSAVAGLSKAAKLELLMADAPELVGLLGELKERTAEVRDVISPILSAVRAGKLPTSSGLSYLEVKHSLLLSYITDIAFLLLLRAEGKSVRDHPVVEQLVHVRALLERMRPLDARLSSQVQRLLRAAHAAEANGTADDAQEDGGAGAEDVDVSDIKGHPALAARQAAAATREDSSSGALARPNPAALLAHGDVAMAKDVLSGKAGKGKAQPKAQAKGKKGKAAHADDEDEDMDSGSAGRAAADDDEDEDEDAANLQGIVGKDGVFRPLRRAAVPFDGDKPKDKAAREAERRKERASRSALLADIQANYSGAPEVEGVDGAGGGMGGRRAVDERLDGIAAERTAYEEDMLTRVTMSKTERKQRQAREREKERWSSLAELEALGDLDDITRAVDAQDELGPAAVGGIAGKKAVKGAVPGVPRTLAQLEAEVRAKERLGGAVARAAETGMASAVGRKATSARSAAALDLHEDDSDDDGDDGPRGGAGRGYGNGDEDEDDYGAGRKRPRVHDDAGAGGEDDEFYRAIAEAAAVKKAKKAAASADFEESRRSFIRNRLDDEALRSKDGKRKISREIATNRGLVKYRKAEERNPRVHNRMKAEKFMKRRKGQVVTMRDHGAEEGRYGGEETGIRTGVVRSRKIKG